MAGKLTGKCIGGPYAGQEWAYPHSQMAVEWIDGNPLKEIPFRREGVYEFMHGVWVWNGPAYKQQAQSIITQ